jgi:hypothetical protein
VNGRTLLSVMVSLALTVCVGCDTIVNEGYRPPTESQYQPDDYAVISLQAVAINSSTVRLRWRAPRSTERLDAKTPITYQYQFTWAPVDGPPGGTDRGERAVLLSVDSTHEAYFETTVTGLAARLYRFRVITDYRGSPGHRDTVVVSGEILAAPAERFTALAGGSAPIRLYEQASSNGSGLIVDPARGGPLVVHMGSSMPPGTVQLGLVVDAPYPTSSMIGSAFAIDRWLDMNVDAYEPTDVGDTMVFQTYSIADAMPLDDWYTELAIAAEIFNTSRAWYRDHWERIDITPPGLTATNSIGMVVRLGGFDDPNARYARIYVKRGANREFLQGEAPNRYVELEISLGYPGVPWA